MDFFLDGMRGCCRPRLRMEGRCFAGEDEGNAFVGDIGGSVA